MRQRSNRAFSWLIVVVLVPRCGTATLTTCREVMAALELGPLVVDRASNDASTCNTSLVGPSDRALASRLPSSKIHDWFEEHGWTEFLSRAADGPGTTAFVFTRGADSCEVSAGAPSYLDGGEIVIVPEYRLELRCVRMADAE